jgi:hypothetical protein
MASDEQLKKIKRQKIKTAPGVSKRTPIQALSWLNVAKPGKSVGLS